MSKKNEELSLCSDMERSPGYIVNLKTRYRTVTTICVRTHIYIYLYLHEETLRMKEKVIQIITIGGMVNVDIVFLTVCFFF